ncbi:putative transmembrane protein 244 isoform X2 [Ascaphus truei]|uniref:putative transmembrane protein 244 isoform X2 n=1 Tax=Ascaphus truei TaxID=8439 RepID=UPI003F59A8FE
MMALKIKVSETKIVLENLLICAAVFYMVYYVAHIICFKALGLDSFDEFGPFDFKTNPSWLNKKYLVNLISLETTFMVCGLLFVLVVEEWIWDYACTVTVIHVIITSMVTMEFPLTGHWWISLVTHTKADPLFVFCSILMCSLLYICWSPSIQRGLI